MNQSLTELLNKHRKTVIGFSIMLGVLLIGSIIVIVSSLSDTTPPLISLPKKILTSPTPTPTPIRSQMYMSPLSIDTSVGKQFKATVTIDAKNKIINGVDSVIIFDPLYLKPLIPVKNPETPKGFDLMRRQVDGNKIIITLVKSKTTTEPTQELPVADVTFQALKKGTTKLVFEYMPGKTVGSTIIQAQGSENILDQVAEMNITIK